MKRELFVERFADAARLAREFARRFLIEELPERIVFDLHLNASYDVNASSEFSMFPEDSGSETALRTKRVDENAVLRWLFRNEMVPQWVNLQVAGIISDATIISIDACGRFIADEQYLYHQGEGRPPFHVLGPTLPVGHEDGVKFSIFKRSVCWSIEDLEFLAQNDAKIWSLEINGPDFTDRLPKNLLLFDTVEILELKGTKISGKLLEVISEMSRLRIVRINQADVVEFDMFSLPPDSKSVTEFSFRGTPGKIKGGAQIRVAFPNLTQLCFAGSHDIDWDQPPDLQGIERLKFSFPEHASWMRDIAGTQSVSLNFDSCDENAIFALLRTGNTSLKSVNLRGTPIGNEIFNVIGAMPELEHFDVVDTKVTNEALSEFTSKRPEISCWPNLT